MDLFNPEKTNFVRHLVEQYDLDPHLFQQACLLCEATIQNGHSLDFTKGDQVVSTPMLAASIPDPHLLLAAYYYDAKIDGVNSENIRPAHMIAVRFMTEPHLARKCALLLHEFGVSFVDHTEKQDPYSVLKNMPSFWQQWKGWSKQREEAGKSKIPWTWKFKALWEHRKNVREGKRLLSQLG